MTLEQQVEQALTAITDAPTTRDATAVATALTPRVLRGLCDLLYLDDIGRKTTLIGRIVKEAKGCESGRTP